MVTKLKRFGRIDGSGPFIFDSPGIFRFSSTSSQRLVNSDGNSPDISLIERTSEVNDVNKPSSLELFRGTC